MAQVAPISQQIWNMKYRLKHADGHPVDKNIDDTWRRVARALSQPEVRQAILGTEIFRYHERFPIPACRTHSVRCRIGTAVSPLFNCLLWGIFPMTWQAFLMD